MDSHCQMAARSGSGEFQILGAVSIFESKNRGSFNSKLKTYIIGSVTYELCLFSLYFVKYIGIHYIDNF